MVRDRDDARHLADRLADEPGEFGVFDLSGEGDDAVVDGHVDAGRVDAELMDEHVLDDIDLNRGIEPGPHARDVAGRARCGHGRAPHAKVIESIWARKNSPGPSGQDARMP